MPFGIVFDFPENGGGDPVFAGWYKNTPGFAFRIDTAMSFATETEAERFLKNSYGPESQSFAAVIEFSAEPMAAS